MKNIITFINEKLKISSDKGDRYDEIIDNKFIKFISEELGIDKKLIRKWYYKYWDVQVWEFFNIPKEDDDSCCTVFDGFFMMAAMLVEDKRPAEEYNKLGFRSYPGNNNPYNFSWFDAEIGNITFLEVCQEYIGKHFNEFKDIYDALKKSYNNGYDNLIDKIWELWHFYDTVKV